MSSASASASRLSADHHKKPKAVLGLQKPSNVFGGDSSEGEDDDEPRSTHNHVNRDLRREQAALRQRAAASIYDFDGTYEAPRSELNTVQDTKKPRYITDLLHQAKRRKQEREIIHERKVAREQAEEDTDFVGKEKFVTTAYKLKLAERESWVQQEKEQEIQEQNEEVTKLGNLGAFYANMNRNVAMGATKKESTTSSSSFTIGFERNDDGNNSNWPTAENETKEERETSENQEGEVLPQKSIQETRQEKISMARLRYFQRRGISPEDAAKERLQ